jgi:methylmalonyl-CoA mutase cobalamin-binding domain/chain
MAEELYAKIQKAIVDLDKERLNKLTEEAIATKVDPAEAIEKAYTVGIQRVGKLFEIGDYFLPELINGAEIVKEAVTEIEKLIPRDKVIRKGKMVIGTVAGDIHDIGKNLVIAWMSTQGFEMVDIGVDCPVDKFIDRAIEEKVDIIGASSLLTMTAPEQMKLVERMEERGLRERFKVLVGGAATDKAWAEEIGADGFAGDMREAAEVALSLLA